jgi:hypothetical protein
MHKLIALSLALALSLAAFAALAAATSDFPCDFGRVARRQSPACAQQPQLLSMVERGVTGS